MWRGLAHPPRELSVSLDDASYPALWSLYAQGGPRPEYVLPVLWSESGFNPAVINSIGCAGVNQACGGLLGRIGMTAEEYASLPASEQIKRGVTPYMLDLVHSYGPLRSGTRVYQGNYLPGTLNSARHLTDVIASSPSPYYTANTGFDTAKKGYITVQDLANAIKRAVAQPAVQEAINNAYRIDAGLSPHGSPEEPVYGTDFGFYEKNRPWLIAGAIFASSAAIAYGLTIDQPRRRKKSI
jgi:hypothetical protein